MAVSQPSAPMMATISGRRPQPEHHLDLAEEVQHLGEHARRVGTALGVHPLARGGAGRGATAATNLGAMKVWITASRNSAVATALNGSASIRREQDLEQGLVRQRPGNESRLRGKLDQVSCIELLDYRR